MPELLVDTDIFVDHLRGTRRFRPGTQIVWYSVVTRAELYAGRGTEEARVGQLLAPFREVDVTRAIAERAGRLHRGSSLRMADALIAASALELGVALLTRNRRAFDGISSLVLAAEELDGH